MPAANSSVLVLGIGNLLWADEGFGVRCVEALDAGWALPADVTVLDGGTQGLYLLPHVSAAARLIVFDAVDYGLAPGTLRLVEGDEVPRFLGARKMSLHQTGFQEVLAAADLLGRLPGEMLLIGVQPEALEDYGGSLRPVVRAQVDAAVDIALARLQAWGLPAQRRSGAGHGLNDRALAIDDYETQRPSAEAACRLGDLRFIAARG